ncbi:spore germination protein [Alteribacillus bidgolensis]|uniref:Spore germination protein PA n=1 Tax=Alteribacillus bidgolensis TaxID=930129 RepID=A0A1G8CWX4_9BACI|nr:spore germination protein [Alteribacillus bidgolensis]SDH49609.1 spore germination protein PA [Alteribacillus bidgolensis]
MPAIVGAVKVINVGGSGVFNIGDVFTISPDSAVKTFAGAGSFNTGDFIKVRSNYSSTNTYDEDIADSNIYPIR